MKNTLIKNGTFMRFILTTGLFLFTLVTHIKPALAVTASEEVQPASDSGDLESVRCTVPEATPTITPKAEANKSNNSRTLIIPADKTTSLDADKLFRMVNNYRNTLGLKSFERDKNLCKLAETRGPEVYKELLYSGRLHSGLYERKLPYWVTENMVLNTSEEGGLNWWMNSPIHYASIVSDAKYSCTKCFGHACIQLFTSYVPRTYDTKN